MSRIRQFYGGTGVPLVIEEDLSAPAAAWRSHRARLRAWLATVPDDEWTGATRCAEWDMTLLVRHLASGSQFLGYTLHKAAAGTSTTLLTGMDTHTTVQAAAAMLGELTPAEACTAMAAMDAGIDVEFDNLGPAGWLAIAEAPPGNLPAYLAVSHFLFDSWVHEYDLMLPRGVQPDVEAPEVVAVVSYVMGLASLASSPVEPLEVRLTDLDLRIGLDVVDGQVSVAVGPGPSGAAVIEGRAADVIDRATGRRSGPVSGDERGLATLAHLSDVLSR